MQRGRLASEPMLGNDVSWPKT